MNRHSGGFSAVAILLTLSAGLISAAGHGGSAVVNPTRSGTAVPSPRLISALSFGPAVMVTNTTDAGPGSLRQAIVDANLNPGPDSIAFAIPTTDPGYNPAIGIWTIKPLTPFPSISNDGTLVDGLSQKWASGDSNPAGPEIQIDGSLAGVYPDGIVLKSSWNQVRGLAINRFGGNAIKILGPGISANLIVNCYLGVSPDAKSKAGNGESGVWVYESSWNAIGWPDTTLGNIIGGNGMAGVTFAGSSTQFNLVSVNCIGTDTTHTRDLGNDSDGIFFFDGASDNAVTGFDFPHHVVIRNNKGAGIRVSGSATGRNFLGAGSITHNDRPGILLEDNGNANMPAPTVTEADAVHVAGMAEPNAMVLLYRDPEDEGEEYFATTYSDWYGNFSWSGSVQGPYVTAVAVDTMAGTSINNTSMFSAPFSLTGVYVVRTTADSGNGSLRLAITCINTHKGPDTIRFAIPPIDPGYNSLTGTWTITPRSPLQYVSDGPLVIDGFSQSTSLGYDANPLGPEIELDGSLAGPYMGISIAASGVDVLGMAINRFERDGIVYVSADGGHVAGCYIGTDPTGSTAAANTNGVTLHDQTRHVVIGADGPLYPGNLISGNYNGIFIRDSSSNNAVRGNIIGLDRTGSVKLGNNFTAISVMASPDNTILGNLVGGNRDGIMIYGQARRNRVEGNWIGCDTLGTTDLGQAFTGISILNSEQNTIRANNVAFSGTVGILVDGSPSLHNSITRNRIWSNKGLGIDNTNGGNAEYAVPSILSKTGLLVSGKTAALDSVELFADDGTQGAVFLGATKADAGGNWTVSLVSAPPFSHLTATARDKDGNTSEFSLPLTVTSAGQSTTCDVPKEFGLEQNYPNPFNPATEIRYQVPVGGGVRLVVYDLLGREVATLVDEWKEAGYYPVMFDARNQASGVYLYRMTAGTFVAVKRMAVVK